MIRRSTEASPDGVLSAYKDNAAVIEGPEAPRFFADPRDGRYRRSHEPIHMLMKVETHNHPTAISPFPGAATGSGGEIRDEGATGRGAKPKAGLVGFSVSNLRLPGAVRPWEQDFGKPARIASALEIMIDGPLGGAAFNNEFGRPALAGYFRSFEMEVPGPDGQPELRGYHKPIMIAGGLGNIRDEHVQKGEIPAGAAIVVLGGPALLIGLGGGAASSVASGASQEDLDFASVQRDNAEMQRRCQEVIDRCWALGEDNPIVSIHDVGAGGLSNALPELVHDSRRGAHFQLRDIPSDEPSMSPLELWCNEAQERYVLAMPAEALPTFEALCRRERAPFAVLGQATADGRLVVDDRPAGQPPHRPAAGGAAGQAAAHAARRAPGRGAARAVRSDGAWPAGRGDRARAAAAGGGRQDLPHHHRRPHGDRPGGPRPDGRPAPGAGGRRRRDVASYDPASHAGEAMAMGERTPLALLDAAAAARMAVAEAMTNIAARPSPSWAT